MKKVLLLVSALWLTLGSVYSQGNRCGTMENLARLMAEDPGYEARMNALEQTIQTQINNNPGLRTSGMITIPVVFHVLYSTNNTTQNVPLARIQAQLAVLNADYSGSNPDTSSVPSVFKPLIANTGIQFCLAKRDQYGNATDGIIRKQTTTTSFSTNDNIKHNSTGGDDAWPSSSYLNIWIGNLGGGLLGYAQFPGGAAATDGVVLLNGSVGGPGALGTTPSYNRGRTATHEIGHWLNLRHINGDSNCGSDFVTDTPTQQALNFGCPTFPQVTCNNGPNGDMFMNYMDYTDDACMYMFSLGQATRINTSVTSSRASLMNSLGCVPVTVGLSNDPIQNGYSIYPNPSQGELTIENTNTTSEHAVVNLYNAVGQNVFMNNYTNFDGTHNIDLSKLSSGIYSIEILVGDKRMQKKVVLNK